MLLRQSGNWTKWRIVATARCILGNAAIEGMYLEVFLEFGWVKVRKKRVCSRHVTCSLLLRGDVGGHFHGG